MTTVLLVLALGEYLIKKTKPANIQNIDLIVLEMFGKSFLLRRLTLYNLSISRESEKVFKKTG